MRALLRLGLPRDPSGSSHIAGFLVATVMTVLLTRGALAALGFPQLGGKGLHIAHVLWGGLLMALALLVLLSFAGPVARPVGALVGGVGFGLFIDEVGKFVTSDNDYFYGPTPSLIYLVVVLLVLLAEGLHGRFPHEPREYLAGAVDHAVAGVVGGLTPRARAEARELLDRAGDVPGAAEVRALLDAVDEDSAELPNPIDAIGAAVVRATRHVVSARWVPWLAVGILLASLVATVTSGMVAWFGGADVPGWAVVGLLVSAAVATATALYGVVVVRGDRMRGYALCRRAILISLLVTQVFVFRIQEWWATVGLVVALLALGLVAAELQQLTVQARAQHRGRRGAEPDAGRAADQDGSAVR